MSGGELQTKSPDAAEVRPTLARLRIPRPGLPASSGRGTSVAPPIIALIVICLAFQLLNGRFLAAENLTNLALQIASTGTIAIGIVLVLLLGEIDVSVAAISGVCGALLAVLYVNHGWDPALAVVVSVIACTVIGSFQGLFVVWLAVPGFVVTLGGLLALGGVQKLLLGDATSINLPFDGAIADLTTTFLPPWLSWTLAAGVVAIYGAVRLSEVRRRQRYGLRHGGVRNVALRCLGLAALTIAAVVVFHQYRGTPLAIVIFVGLVVGAEFVVKNTRYGKHLLALGGDAEAARRNGVRVNAVRVSVFAAAGMFAAIGGVLAASRTSAATLTAGAGDVLISAIAAAVIGGTSMFGGRGTVYSALVGMLVIGAIANGMDLLAVSDAVKDIVTGTVLGVAITVDAISRRIGASSAGRRGPSPEFGK